MRRKALASAIHSNCVASREIREEINSLIGFDMSDPQWNIPVAISAPVEYSQEDMDKMLALIKAAKPTISDFLKHATAPHYTVMQGIIMPWRLAVCNGV